MGFSRGAFEIWQKEGRKGGLERGWGGVGEGLGGGAWLALLQNSLLKTTPSTFPNFAKEIFKRANRPIESLGWGGETVH